MKFDIGSILSILSYAIGVLGIGGGVFSFLRYNNYQTTVKLQNDSIAALEKNNEILSAELEKTRDSARNEHTESMKAIGVLEGRIQSYKEIPLKSISESLRLLATNQESIKEVNTRILDRLNNSADILVKETKSVANAVETVKTDLAHNKPITVEIKD